MYVWIDLPTIPQIDKDSPVIDPELAKIQKMEIVRQPTIFHNASYTLAWLNDVSSWTSMQTILELLCMVFLKGAGLREDGDDLFDLLFERSSSAVDSSAEIFTSNPMGGSHPYRRFRKHACGPTYSHVTRNGSHCKSEAVLCPY